MLSVRQRAVRGREEEIALPVERDGPHAGERLVIEIGNPDVEGEIVEAPLDLDRGERPDGNRDVRMLARERQGEERYHG